MAENNGPYLIVNITQGLFDGNYFISENDVKHIVDRWKEEFPGDDIFHVLIMGKPQFRTPDERWMPNHIKGIGGISRAALKGEGDD